MLKDKAAIAAAFGGAAATYDAVSAVQTLAARRLADRITGGWQAPKMLDLGAGTGHLARAMLGRFPAADLTLADIAPTMLAVARGTLPKAHLVAADAEALPFAAGSFDIIGSNLALQWCEDLGGTLARAAALLRPGGLLAATTLLAGTWAEWRRAHQELGLVPAMRDFPGEAEIRHALPWVNRISVETLVRPYQRGREFLRDIARLGSGSSARELLSARDLSRVLRRFEADEPVASYQIATILLRRPARAGVFIAGTDTNIGKTVVSAILARAWDADYWKPVQTGLSIDPGDSAFIAGLGIRTHPPRYALQAPLSPFDAASRENITIDLADFTLPATSRALIVEAAGGVASPLDACHDMADLAVHLGLPAVLVARSGLGTINHSLLAIDALRRRGTVVLGVVLVGHPNPGNRAEIERRGNVHILLECPHYERLDRATIGRAGAELHASPDLGTKLGWGFW